MAQEDVVVRYRAEVDELTRQLKVIADQQQKLAQGQNTVQKELGETSTASRKLATDVNTAGKSFQKAATDSKGFSSSVKKEVSGIGAQVQNIGIGIASGIAAAFSVQAVIQFGKASINAFLEAQENAEKLRFAITQIGGESEAAFNRLIEQSSKLQGITIFSDDSIQQAQAVLSTFGLTSDQIEELLPKLADFASVTKTDIVSAANSVGQGLQGMGREFKKFGIEVSANQTPLENLNILIDGFAKFEGAAAKETETLTGQLKQQANQVDELQERVGEGLAPAWIKVRQAIFESTLAAIEFIKSGGVGLATRQLEKASEGLITNNEKVKKAVQETAAELLKQGKTQEEASTIAIRSVQAEIIERLRLRAEQFKAAQEGGAATEAQIRTSRLRFEAVRNELKAVQALFEANQRNRDLSERQLTTDELRGKSINELNKLLALNSQLTDLVSKSNVELINKELAARDKLAKEAAKQAEELTKKEQAELQKRKDEVRDWVNDVAGFLNDARLKKSIEVKLENTKQFESDLEDLNNKRIESDDAYQKTVEDKLKKRIEQQAQANELILQNSAALASELSALFQNLGDKQIEEIERVRDRRLEDIDEELETLTDQRESKLINEEDFETRSAQLKQKRVDAEKKATDEINKIKKRQAILDKLAAIFNIIINTQQAVSLAMAQLAAFSPPVIAFLQALGALQVATVIAQPIPKFEKGTKKKKGSSLALVGEKGPEVTYLPDQAKVLPAREVRTYGKVLDAMFDNNLDRYVHKTYVAPALIKQQQKHEAAKQQEFAQNISNSFAVQNIGGMDEYGMRRALNKPLTIRKESAEYLAKALADQLKPDFRTL